MTVEQEVGRVAVGDRAGGASPLSRSASQPEALVPRAGGQADVGRLAAGVEDRHLVAAGRSHDLGHSGRLEVSARQVGGGQPWLLDLFCGGGGAGVGYARAGFQVVGVDINPQGNYPYEFIQADALALDPAFVAGFDAIHASPPCQKYTRKAANWGRERKHWTQHPDLVAPTRAMLEASGKPYVIENVPGAPIRPDLVLCGTMFGLRIIKHRWFELSFPVAVLLPPCDHSDVYNPWQGAGRSADKLRAAQGIDWLPISGGASRKNGYTGDLFNAIPPAYTEFVGGLLLDSEQVRRAA